MNAPAVSARRLLAEELARGEPELDLARAALLVAKEEYPQLSVELYLARLDQAAEDVKDRLADETAPLVVLDELLQTLYGRHRLEGNRKAYYDPRNSFLNDVLDRGVGIPLTLGIVLLEVGWRLGLPLEGVNFPGHFLVRFRGDGIALLIDPFDGGKIRFEDQAQELLDQIYGGVVRLQDNFLRAASKREMLKRLLTNLKGLYVKVGDHARALAAVERLLMITPTAPAEARSRGVLLARMGRHEEAALQLEAYLRVSPAATDAPRVEEMLRALRAGEAPADDGVEL
ncbi:MAG TPA: transglutaminase-like domain-containing protein [Longimicrobiales bacterium]|nr:transglutaminase-like domain-containing protein [Longimicrobiales bacterium]